MKYLVFFMILLIVVPQIASANPCQSGPGASLSHCITQIYTWSLGGSGILGVLMIVLGGYKVMTAGGNAEQASSGKSYILSAIVGICLLFGAYLILNTINPDLVKFKDITNNSFNAPPPANQNPPPPPVPRTP